MLDIEFYCSQVGCDIYTKWDPSVIPAKLGHQYFCHVRDEGIVHVRKIFGLEFTWCLLCSILILKIRNVGGGVAECSWGMGRDSGKSLHQLDVLWVCGQPHIPVVGSNSSCMYSKYPTEVCLYAEMQRVCTCYTIEITNHCYTAKITLCSLVGDCRTPVSQHRALARVGH